MLYHCFSDGTRLETNEWLENTEDLIVVNCASKEERKALARQYFEKARANKLALGMALAKPISLDKI